MTFEFRSECSQGLGKVWYKCLVQSFQFRPIYTDTMYWDHFSSICFSPSLSYLYLDVEFRHIFSCTEAVNRYLILSGPDWNRSRPRTEQSAPQSYTHRLSKLHCRSFTSWRPVHNLTGLSLEWVEITLQMLTTMSWENALAYVIPYPSQVSTDQWTCRSVGSWDKKGFSQEKCYCLSTVEYSL